MMITVRIYKKNKLVGRRMADKSNWRKLYGKLASAGGDKWFVQVAYGYDKNVFGKRTLFKNEGEYTKLSEAKRALSAFLEQ